MNSPEYKMLDGAIEDSCKRLSNALHEAMKIAYWIGHHDGAKALADRVIGLDAEPKKDDVTEMCRRLWEENDK